ncbi:hypothetical protein [Moraxella lacunata]|uniref:hypothetical protein n=1 Tax=Moraxella lacunata TaxID=477 RepID=UPI003EE14EC0
MFAHVCPFLCAKNRLMIHEYWGFGQMFFGVWGRFCRDWLGKWVFMVLVYDSFKWICKNK